jgi:hypothetical protein
MGSVKGVFYRKMVLYAGFFLAFVSSLWLTLFDFLNRASNMGGGDGLLMI